MNFVSFSFAMFFLVVYAGRLIYGRRKTERPYLLSLVAASLVFYSWHVPVFTLIILLSTAIDYFAGLYLGRADSTTVGRKAAIVVSVSTNLGLLFFFKYSNFLLEEMHRCLNLMGIDVNLPTLSIALPIGISFYTFQSMSYSIDVYRGVLQPLRQFWKLLLFVSFFPQLVAGPIVRAKEFIYQIERPRRVSMHGLTEGAWLIIRGFFLKMVVADNLGVIVSQYWDRSAIAGASSSVAALTVLLFSFQIFADFAGYSSIARGLAYLLGFRLPVNFNSPYIAGSFSAFWTRWHITLSQWLRDYLYISLGGNRKGAFRTYFNLIIVMLLGGLWHGAAMTFVVWGALHGVALFVERLLGLNDVARNPSVIVRGAWFLVVQGTVLVAWIFFRAEDVGQAWSILTNILGVRFGSVGAYPLGVSLLLLAPVALGHLRAALWERWSVPQPGGYEKAALSASMLYCCVTCYGVNNEFIYFQF